MKTVGKLKRGDVDPKTGLVYWDTLYGVHRWRSAGTVAKWKKRLMRYVIAWQKADIPRHRACQRRLRERHGRARNARSRGFRNAWKKRQRKNNPIYALGVNCSSRLRIALKRAKYSKSVRVCSLLGCTLPELKSHLESQFTAGMSWSNYGYWGWHVDHRIPVSSAKNRAAMYRLFHFSNLQPLWQKDNFAKRDKLIAA